MLLALVDNDLLNPNQVNSIIWKLYGSLLLTNGLSKVYIKNCFILCHVELCFVQLIDDSKVETKLKKTTWLKKKTKTKKKQSLYFVVNQANKTQTIRAYNVTSCAWLSSSH